MGSPLLTLLRRRATATAWTPSVLSGLVVGATVERMLADLRLWTDVGMTVNALADGDEVRTPVAFGQDIPFPTAVDGTRSVLKDEGGGKWSLEFHGGHFSADLSAHFPTAGTVWVAAVIDAADTSVKILQTGSYDAWDNVGGLSYPQLFRANRLDSKPPVPTGVPTYYIVRSDGTGWDRYMDGVEDLNEAADFSSGAGWRLGEGTTGRVVSWGGYSRRITDAERLKLADYLVSILP